MTFISEFNKFASKKPFGTLFPCLTSFGDQSESSCSCSANHELLPDPDLFVSIYNVITKWMKRLFNCNNGQLSSYLNPAIFLENKTSSIFIDMFQRYTGWWYQRSRKAGNLCFLKILIDSSARRGILLASKVGFFSSEDVWNEPSILSLQTINDFSCFINFFQSIFVNSCKMPMWF